MPVGRHVWRVGGVSGRGGGGPDRWVDGHFWAQLTLEGGRVKARGICCFQQNQHDAHYVGHSLAVPLSGAGAPEEDRPRRGCYEDLGPDPSRAWEGLCQSSRVDMEPVGGCIRYQEGSSGPGGASADSCYGSPKGSRLETIGEEVGPRVGIYHEGDQGLDLSPKQAILFAVRSPSPGAEITAREWVGVCITMCA